jgi:cystathionine beta-lyase family protein involved in aluminum resistance
MVQLTLNIKDNKFQTFIEFIKTLDYVEVPEVDKKSLDELQISLEQVKLMQDGEIEKQTANDFLNEL